MSKNLPVIVKVKYMSATQAKPSRVRLSWTDNNGVSVVATTDYSYELGSVYGGYVKAVMPNANILRVVNATVNSCSFIVDLGE